MPGSTKMVAVGSGEVVGEGIFVWVGEDVEVADGAIVAEAVASATGGAAV